MDSVTRQITNTVFYQIQVSMRGIHLAILARSRKRYVYLVCTFLYNNYLLLSHGCHFQARYIQANIWNVVIENSIVNDFQFFIICSRIIFLFPPSYRLCVSAKFKMNYLQKKNHMFLFIRYRNRDCSFQRNMLFLQIDESDDRWPDGTAETGVNCWFESSLVHDTKTNVRLGLPRKLQRDRRVRCSCIHRRYVSDCSTRFIHSRHIYQ